MEVSVIIPTHNRAELVVRAVKSVLKQTYRKYEIIVVSDGSTDMTDILMEEIKKKDDRIKYISYQIAKGANHARNMGIENAQFEYIAFLDDDDEWLPEKLEKQIKVFKNDEKIGLVYSGVNAIYTDENLTYTNIPILKGDLSKEILFKNCIGTTSTVILKANLLKEFGTFDVSLKACQDYDLWIRIAQSTRVGVVSEPVVNYYNYPGNNQISQQTEKYKEAYKYISNKYNNLYKQLSKREIRIVNRNICIFLANNSLRNANKKECRKQIKKSLEFGLKPTSFILYFCSFFNYKLTLKLRSWI